MNRFSQALEEEIAALERELEAHPAYAKLKALRATRELYANVTPQRPGISGVQRSRNAALSGKSLDAVSAVIEILRDEGRAMRTAELMPLVNDRGITFSGNAPQNVLSSLLSRSSDVVSMGGHIGWALKEWDTAGSAEVGANTLPADDQPEAQGREAGPGGGT
jgi:hypothetical protein